MFHNHRFRLLLLLISFIVQPGFAWAAGLADVYNQGVRQYEQSKFDDAAASFKQAAASSDDIIAAQARYNLGNTLYAKAIDLIRSSNEDQIRLGDGPASSSTLKSSDASRPAPDSSPIEILKDAVGAYRSSLRLNPDDEDARFNLENATRLIDQLKDQQSDQKSPEQNQQQSQSKDQQQQKDSTDQPEQNPKQNPEQKPNDRDAELEQPQEQPQDGNGESGESGESDQGEDGEEDSDDQNKPDEKEKGEQGDQKPSDQSKPSNQQQPDQQQQGNSQPGTESASGQSAAKEMTQQEAEQMLQAIRDRDMQRRNRLEALKRSRRVVVPRDW